jgi:hypothetical protein
MPADEPADRGGPVFAEYIAGELKVERERRSTLDQRGISAVTSSGVVVALSSGLAALAALKPGDFKPSDIALALMAATLLGFACAAFLGILANRSLGHSPGW